MWGNSVKVGLFGSTVNGFSSHFVHYPNKKQEDYLKDKLGEKYEKVYKK